MQGRPNPSLEERGVMPLPVDVAGAGAVLVSDGLAGVRAATARTGMLLVSGVLLW